MLQCVRYLRDVVQRVIFVAGLAAQLVDYGDQPVHLVVLVLLSVPFRVCLGGHIARQVVREALRRAVGIGHLLQQAFGGVGEGCSVAQRVGFAGEVAQRVVGIGGLTVQLIHHGDEAVDIVVLVLLCVAFRVGLGNHIARQIVGKGLRCAVGVGHLLQQAFGGVGTPKIIL